MKPVPPVIAAVDFSPCSGAALRRAERIAAWKNAPLVALHVVEVPTPVGMDPFFPEILTVPLPAQDELVAAARARWEVFARQCGAEGRASLVIEVGIPRDAILEHARRRAPSMLVIGAHSAADAHRGIGTTAAACAQWAPGPVLVVREGQEGPFRVVLACVDFSDTSRRALEQAIGLATEDEATLHVLHVYADPWRGRGVPEGVRRNMPDFAERYRQAVTERLRAFGEPLRHELNAVKAAFHALEAPRHADEIVAFVRRHACDLVVLGTRGAWNMRDLFWGSTAERVVRSAPCSVLTVKPTPPGARTAAPKGDSTP